MVTDFCKAENLTSPAVHGCKLGLIHQFNILCSCGTCSADAFSKKPMTGRQSSQACLKNNLKFQAGKGNDTCGI